MSWNDPDVYYQPEKFGLTPVAEIDYSSGSYEFDYRCVWRHEDGTLYTARDSGCSCPSPFETYTTLADLDVLDMAALKAEVDHERDGRYSYLTADDAARFLRTVFEHTEAPA